MQHIQLCINIASTNSQYDQYLNCFAKTAAKVSTMLLRRVHCVIDYMVRILFVYEHTLIHFTSRMCVARAPYTCILNISCIC